MSDIIELKAGLSEASYDPKQGRIFLKGWVSHPSQIRSVSLVSGDTVLVPSIAMNVQRIDIRRKYDLTDELANGFEQRYAMVFNGDPGDLTLIVKPISETVSPYKIDVAMKVAEMGYDDFNLETLVYDTESKFLRLSGVAYPKVPQRRLRIVLSGGRSESVQNAFLPSQNFTEKTGGVINKFGGFDTKVKFVGQGALSSIQIIADLIDGSETSWSVDPTDVLYDQPEAELSEVCIDKLNDRLIVRGWYRSYQPVTTIELRVFGRTCFAIPEIVGDEDLTRKLGFRGPTVQRFNYEVPLSLAVTDLPEPGAVGINNQVSLSLMSQNERVGQFSAQNEAIQLRTAGASYVVFDKRTSLLMIWGQCAPDQPPKDVGFMIAGRQIGQRLVPTVANIDPTAKVTSWFVAEEINFELNDNHKFELEITTQGDETEILVDTPKAIIVSAEQIVEGPDKAAATQILYRHNSMERSLEAPTVCFVFQGSMTVVGGAVTRIKNMMASFKRAGYSVVLLDRTAPWEMAASLSSYKAMRAYCDEHLMIPQYYKSDILSESVKDFEGRKNLSPSENNLLNYLRKTKKEGRLLTGDGSGLYKRVDSHFNYACAAAIHNFKPDVVVTQFAWSCEIHTALPNETLGFLDTHDIQSARYENFAEAHEKYGSDAIPDLARYVVDPKTEQLFLNKADACIAISPDERLVLNDMIGSRKTVLAALSTLEAQLVGSPKDSQSILFVGNFYEANNYGISRFINEIWPKVRAAVGDGVTLNVVGSSCESLTGSSDPNVKLLGRVEDLAPLYEEAAVVINPMYFGTGMAVKMVEALSNGKAVVSTSVGMRGLTNAGDLGAASVADDNDTFANETIRLLTKPRSRAGMEKAAYEYADTYLKGDIVYSDLFNFIESKLFY
jgi:hypothetical protein